LNSSLTFGFWEFFCWKVKRVWSIN
jgi:hypothetical protein